MKIINMFRWKKVVDGVEQEAALSEQSIRSVAESNDISVEELTEMLSAEAGGGWYEVHVKYPWTYGDALAVERAITRLEGDQFVRDAISYIPELMRHAIKSWEYPEQIGIENLPHLVAEATQMAVLSVITPNFNKMLDFKKPSADAQPV